MTHRHEMTLWDHAVELADAAGNRPEGNHTLSVLAVFPSHAEAERQRGSQEPRRDILAASWGSSALLGHRTDVILADRADFLEAWAFKPHGDREGTRELHRRHEWLIYSLLCRLKPGGRIVLV